LAGGVPAHGGGHAAEHRDKLTGLQAFATLTHASKDTNIKLVDVARWLISQHENGVTGSKS
jgi:hypothetical protein